MIASSSNGASPGALTNVHSAVYVDGRTGDKRGEVRGQEQKDVPDLCWARNTPHRDRAQDFVKDLLTHQIAADFGINHSGSHRITRMPLGPSSRAMSLVKPSMPAFAAE